MTAADHQNNQNMANYTASKHALYFLNFGRPKKVPKIEYVEENKITTEDGGTQSTDARSQREVGTQCDSHESNEVGTQTIDSRWATVVNNTALNVRNRVRAALKADLIMQSTSRHWGTLGRLENVSEIVALDFMPTLRLHPKHQVEFRSLAVLEAAVGGGGSVIKVHKTKNVYSIMTVRGVMLEEFMFVERGTVVLVLSETEKTYTVCIAMEGDAMTAQYADAVRSNILFHDVQEGITVQVRDVVQVVVGKGKVDPYPAKVVYDKNHTGVLRVTVQYSRVMMGDNRLLV